MAHANPVGSSGGNGRNRIETNATEKRVVVEAAFPPLFWPYCRTHPNGTGQAIRLRIGRSQVQVLPSAVFTITLTITRRGFMGVYEGLGDRGEKKNPLKGAYGELPDLDSNQD